MSAPAPVPNPRILIAEDESGIADTLQYVLRSDGFTPVWCATAQEAIVQFAQEPPALAILDVGLPDLNGFELFKRLHALPGGADDYIAKPFSPRELVARVRTVLRRTVRAAAAVPVAPPAPPAARPPQPFLIDGERRQIRYYGRALELSRYEYGLLCLFVQRPGRVYTRDELLEMVWDDPGESFDRTVDAHIKTLRAKLKAVAPDVEPIRTLRGTGYALNEDLPTTA